MADTNIDDDALLQPQLDLVQALARELRAADQQQQEYEARVHRLDAEREAMAQQKQRDEERARQQATLLQEQDARQQPDREQRRQRVVAVIQEEPRLQQAHPALSGMVR